MCSGNISAREKQSVNFFWEKTTVWNCISVFLCEFMLTTCFIQSWTCNIMHIKIEISIIYNIIFMLYRLRNFFLGNFFTPSKFYKSIATLPSCQVCPTYLWEGNIRNYATLKNGEEIDKRLCSHCQRQVPWDSQWISISTLTLTITNSKLTLRTLSYISRPQTRIQIWKPCR